MVILRVDFDVSGANVDSRTEGDGDARLQIDVLLVGGRNALLDDDISTDGYI